MKMVVTIILFTLSASLSHAVCSRNFSGRMFDQKTNNYSSLAPGQSNGSPGTAINNKK